MKLSVLKSLLKRTAIGAAVIAAFIACLGREVLANDHAAEAKHSEAKSDSKHGDAKPTVRRKDAEGASGLYFGKIEWVDEKYRALFLKPLEGNAARRTVYLDRATIYRQNRKPLSRTKLEVGQKVGVRYLREDDITYAEGVFLFDDTPDEKDFEMPVKKRAPTEAKKEGGEHGAPKGGAHGAAKPAAKPAAPAPAKKGGGGHH